MIVFRQNTNGNKPNKGNTEAVDTITTAEAEVTATIPETSNTTAAASVTSNTTTTDNSNFGDKAIDETTTSSGGGSISWLFMLLGLVALRRK